MDALTFFGAASVATMLLAYAFEQRSTWWIFIFTLACAASSSSGFLAGTWPFGVVEAIWSLIAFRRWWQRHRHHKG